VQRWNPGLGAQPPTACVRTLVSTAIVAEGAVLSNYSCTIKPATIKPATVLLSSARSFAFEVVTPIKSLAFLGLSDLAFACRLSYSNPKSVMKTQEGFGDCVPKEGALPPPPLLTNHLGLL
jgi:hypothetical protein